MRILFGRKRSKKSTYQKPKPRKPEFEVLEKRWLLHMGVISSLDEALVLSDRPLFRDLDRDPLDVFAVDPAHKQKPPAGTAASGGGATAERQAPTLGNASTNGAPPPTSGSAASSDNSWQGAAAFASEAWGGGASFAPPSGHSVGASPAVIDTPGPPSISGMNFSGPPNINLTNITTALAIDPPYTSAGGFSANINWGDGQQSTGRVFYGPSGLWHFYVQGDHLYSAVGSYTVTTTLTDPGGGQLTATGVGTILNRGVIKRPDVYFKNVGVCRCT